MEIRVIVTFEKSLSLLLLMHLSNKKRVKRGTERLRSANVRCSWNERRIQRVKKKYVGRRVKGLTFQQSVILYDAGLSNPISIHISISQASGSQFETVEGTWLARRTGEINGREFTGKSQRGGCG